MNKILKFNYSETSNLGCIGEQVRDGIHVGDVMSVIWGGKVVTNVICKQGNDTPFLMGLGGESIEKLVYTYKCKKVIPYNLLTNELLNHIEKSVEIADAKEIEMTIAEIEEKLGYKIKVVSE